MNLLNNPAQLFHPEAAIKAAAELKEGDPDWDYTVVHDPKGIGYSFIEIHDEDGELVGRV